MKIRKIISSIIFSMLAAFMVISNTITASALSLGDSNGDGTIDAIDASVILTAYSRTATGKPSGLSTAQAHISDTNKDGNIDAIDASLVLGYYAYTATGGKITFPSYVANPPTTKPTAKPTTKPATQPTTAAETEPAEVIPSVVYYTKSGSKYHYENPCGNGTYYPCSLEEAEARGLEPCAKCVPH